MIFCQSTPQGSARKHTATLGLWLAVLTLVGCSTLPPTYDPDPTGFAEGRRLTGTLDADGVAEWRLAPQEDLYLHLRFDPKGADALLGLTSGNEVMGEIHAEAKTPYVHRLHFVVSAATGATLRLAMPEGGEFEILVVESHPAVEGDRQRAAALLDLAAILPRLGPNQKREDYEELLAQLRAVEGEIRRFAPDYLPEALLRISQANIYLDAYEAAEAPIREAISLFEALPDPSGRELGQLAEAYALLSRVISPRGELAEAVELLSRGIEIYSRWETTRYAQALFLNNRGRIRRDLGQYEAAADDFQQSILLSQQSSQPRLEATARMQLATLYQTVGRLPEAFDQLETVRPLADSLGVSGQIQFLTTSGQYALITGRFGEAGELLERGLRLAREQGDVGHEARILSLLGELRRAMGATASSRHYLEAALGVAAEHGLSDWSLDAHLQLGELWVDDGDVDSARSHLREASRVAQDLGSRSGELAATLAMARLELSLGRAEAADGLARAAVRKAADLTPLHELRALTLLAEADLAAGKAAQARERVELALDLCPQEDLIHQARLRVLQGLAAKREGDLEQARIHLDEGLSHFEAIRGRIWSPSARTEYLARWHSYYGELIEVLIRLDARYPEQGYVQEAFDVSERSKARTLSEILTHSRLQVSSDRASDLAAEERRVADHLALLHYELESPNLEADEDRMEVLRGALATSQERSQAVEEELWRRDRRYADLRYPEPLAFDQVASLLGADTLLLHFAVGDRSGHLFVVSKDDVTVHPLPPDNDLRRQVTALREAIQNFDIRSKNHVRTLSQSLGRLLFGPTLDQTEARRLWIVADGPLHRLPFELLQDESGRFLGQDFEVSYVPSATVLATLEEAPARAHSLDLVAVASGDGLEAGNESLPPLPGVQREVRDLAEMFPQTSVTLTGADANEDTLAAIPELAAARWVHFATHALIRDDDPTRSAILLAPTETGDRLLEMSEIFDLRLSADTVVLSACETGLGREVAGEGIIGLSRAFLYAGSRSLVVSLWPVSDNATARFMRRFYQHLQSGLAPAAALAETKRKLIDEVWAPVTWAPFIVVGGQSTDHGISYQTAAIPGSVQAGEGGRHARQSE